MSHCDSFLIVAKKINCGIILGGVGGGGGGSGGLLVSCVPMRERNNDEKGYFFSIWAVRSAFIIKGRKSAIFIGKADQCLCFRYTDSTIPLLPTYKISSL